MGLAFLADKGYLRCIREAEADVKVKPQLTDEDLSRFSRENGTQLTDEELQKYMGTESQKMSKAMGSKVTS